ncbi:MAG: FeoA family protein [Phycisphaerae bacterium]
MKEFCDKAWSCGTMALCDGPAGAEVVVTGLEGCECARRLREMGLHEGRVVRIVSSPDPVICQIDQSRVALGRRLAECIQVRAALAAS